MIVFDVDALEMMNEDSVRRLISLFREADDDQWSPSRPPAPAEAHEQPLYFTELLQYLREQKAGPARKPEELAVQ